jgi:hypothetical protein
MLDNVSLGVSDLARSRRFYDIFHCGSPDWERQSLSAVYEQDGSAAEQTAMAFRVHHVWPALILYAILPSAAHAQGYPGYPYSIMTPERGAAAHQRAPAHRRVTARDSTTTSAAATQPHRPSLLGHEKFIAKLHRRGLYAARGSSGSVLPTPLPKTQLIPPEGGGTLILPPLQQEQGRTRIPGTAQIVPNLPHGQETFQDRASRCTFQSGLYAVPGNLRNQYMGACLQ